MILVILAVVMLQPHLCNTYPRFVNLNSIISIRENIPKGTQIMRLEVSGDDTLSLMVEYPLGQVPINNRTFQIITMEPNLDYERVSAYQVPFTLTETVAGIMHSQPLKRVVTLRLEDVNDNAPEFRSLPYTASVAEDSLPGTQVFTVSAFDRDSGYGKILEYTITGGNEKGLFYMLSADNPNITLSGALDYEREQVYLLYINATDNYLNPDRNERRLSTKQLVLINVVDIQDTPPYFRGYPHVTAVPENVPKGTVIATVVAEDGDRQRPRRIKYYFIDGSMLRSSIWNFAISLDTGVISTTATLDRENLPFNSATTGVVTLFVQAQEVPFPEELSFTFNATRDSSIVPVTIEVTDVDDNAPSFSLNFVSASVVENSPVNSPIRMASVVTVSDPDMGRNGSFTLTLRRDGYPFTDFYVLPQEVNNFAAISIYVSNAQILDYETVRSLSFQVVAVSQTTPIKTSVLNVTVSLIDANDNYPQFTRNSYDAVIPESCNSNTPVTITKALDADAREFGIVTYALHGAEGRFRIDSRSGEVFTNCFDCLDREAVPSYLLTVSAVDGGGLVTNALLSVRLSDINDNPPKFLRPVWNAFLRENSWQFQSPTAIQAVDDDEPGTENSRLTYSITGGDPYGYFAIDSRTGNVSIRQPADTEQFWGQQTPVVLEVMVMVSDHGRLPLRSISVIRIILEDSNDNTPIFTTLPAEVVVMENTAIGSIIHTAAAIDRDMYAPNNQIVYSILNGSQGMFIINAATGNISVAGQLDKEQVSSHRLVIACSDFGVPPRSSLSTLTINLADVNDKSPKFQAESPVFSVAENSTLGTTIGRMTAEDPDASLPLVYSIELARSRFFDPSSRLWKPLVAGEQLFGIGRNNGSIFVASSLDRERSSRVELLVIAKDMSATPIQSSSGTAQINVLDINDNAPMFDRKEYQASVIYGDLPQKTILRLQDHVIDPDMNPVFWFYQRGGFAMSTEIQAALSRDPLAVMSNGDVRAALTFPPDVRGEITFTVGVNDSLGRGDTATVKVHTIGREHLALVTLDKPIHDNAAIRDWLVRAFKDTTGVTIGIDRIEANAANRARSDVYLYVPVRNDEKAWTTNDVLKLIEQTPSLRNVLTEYGMQDTKAAMLAERGSSARKDYVVATAICAVLAALLAVLVVVCFIVRRKLQRKLREAHSVSADTHTLGFDLGPIDTRAVPVSVSISSSLKKPINGSNPIYRDANDELEHNGNWTRRNGGYESKQQKLHKHYCGSEHRNSVDDNVIIPLTSSESGDMSRSCGSTSIYETSAIMPRPKTPALVVSEHSSPMRSLKTPAAKATPPAQSRSSLRRGATRDQYYNSSAVNEHQIGGTAPAEDRASDSSLSLPVDRLLLPLEPPAGFQTFSAYAPCGPKLLANSAI